MRMIFDIPAVASCTIGGCAFNQKNKCHAKAITIGNSGNPSCDTFHPSDHHVSNVLTLAGVGACKTGDCANNEDFECAATEIHVGMSGGRNICLSYQQRINQ